MKRWECADIFEISFRNTEDGGMPSRDFDQQWFDENGALHVNFSEGAPTGGSHDFDDNVYAAES